MHLLSRACGRIGVWTDRLAASSLNADAAKARGSPRAMSGTDSFKSKVAEMARRIRNRSRRASGDQRSSEIDEIATSTQKGAAKVRQHVEDTNARIERGIRPDGEKFRL